MLRDNFVHLQKFYRVLKDCVLATVKEKQRPSLDAKSPHRACFSTTREIVNHLQNGFIPPTVEQRN